MDFIKENRAAIVVAVLIAGMVTIGVLANNSDTNNKGSDTKQTTENKDKSSDKKATEDKDTEDNTAMKHEDDHSHDSMVKKTDSGVSLTAASGDSYTTLARQAVQDADSSLSKAQVVAAETYLTQWAGEPAVDVSEVVAIKKADLDKAVKKAKDLSKADIAAWNTYVPYVQF